MYDINTITAIGHVYKYAHYNILLLKVCARNNITMYLTEPDIIIMCYTRTIDRL